MKEDKVMELDEQIVDAVMKELFVDCFDRYRSSLSQVSTGDDAYAKAGNVLAGMSESDRNDVLAFLKVAMSDTASIIFGMLDGVHFPDGVDGDFMLTYKGKNVQGDLQDTLLAKIEDMGIL